MKYLFSLVFLLFTSCLQENKREENNLTESYPSGIKEIIFPNKVELNKEIEGTLILDLNIDTILQPRLTGRHTFLYVTTAKLKDINAEKIQKVDHWSFIDRSGKGEFNFKVKFYEKGKRSLFFVVEDYLLLKPKDSSYSLGSIKTEHYKEIKVLVID